MDCLEWEMNWTSFVYISGILCYHLIRGRQKNICMHNLIKIRNETSGIKSDQDYITFFSVAHYIHSSFLLCSVEGVEYLCVNVII